MINGLAILPVEIFVLADGLKVALGISMVTPSAWNWGSLLGRTFASRSSTSLVNPGELAVLRFCIVVRLSGEGDSRAWEVRDRLGLAGSS